jgi:hypothetical protein
VGYRVVHGNIFDTLPRNRKILLPHIANDAGIWGKGFTQVLDQHWPEIGKRFKAWTETIKSTELEPLGEVCFDFVQGSEVLVLSMVAQHKVFSAYNLKPIRYAALIRSMERVVEIGKGISCTEIHCPKFGAGLARGNWDFIQELIQEIWVDQNFDVTVYNFGGLRR